MKILVTNKGSNYTSPPTVVIDPPPRGRQATATAGVQGGLITSVMVTDPGEGYTDPPEISFVGGGGSGATAKIERSV